MSFKQLIYATFVIQRTALMADIDPAPVDESLLWDKDKDTKTSASSTSVKLSNCESISRNAS